MTKLKKWLKKTNLLRNKFGIKEIQPINLNSFHQLPNWIASKIKILKS